MIHYISISNFAIIENTEVEFNDGLNIITGETGSGKSIVIEAISLALGSRADSSFVRHGKDKAVIQLAGTLNNEEIVIIREISTSGRNLCRINGQVVTLSELNETCRRLADIHGQYDNQSLMNPDNHIQIVDRFQNDKIAPLKRSFAEAYSSYSEARSELNRLVSAERENAKKLDFYRFEKNEIDNASLTPGEDEILADNISVLQNSEKIFDGIGTARSSIDGDTAGAVTALGTALHSLQEISSYSKDINRLAEETADIYYRVQDISSSLRDISENARFSPDELDNAISRLDLIDGLKKKYGDTIEDILTYRDKISAELNQIENFDEVKKELTEKTERLRNALIEKAEHLTDARKKSASILEKLIENELHDLNFNSAAFRISFEKADTFTPEGNDIVEMLISANKGEPPKPLAKIASGGEISRIMLAIKNITGTYDNIPTMIFDEIDTGISGVTASIVGRKLHEISKQHQIICITHLPQIASFGDYNYRICKETDGENTFTKIEKLDSSETVNEIARLLGGEKITEITRRNAVELIELSK